MVQKVILESDQQTSIFLQQKLKTATGIVKNEIILSITEYAYELMLNRFGNFLLQRCLEYGSEAQVDEIAQVMIHRVYTLATNQFGCHVVQKILDCVNWSDKKIIINEMCAHIFEGMTDRYACHVWQKLFELHWDCETIPKPPLMEIVNQELRGRWTSVALGETGSLVVQNIFENCLPEEKLECIYEVIDNLDKIIRGQWGNWVIQHMVTYSAEPFRTTVVDHVIKNAPKYSVDQFASKAVEKMLKMGDPVIIQKFLDRVLQKTDNRPRIPLIDIASDAHGNYLVQYILQSGTPKQKDVVAAQIRKHIVSLRGSKWGSKCAWLIDKNRSGGPVGARESRHASMPTDH